MSTPVVTITPGPDTSVTVREDVVSVAMSEHVVNVTLTEGMSQAGVVGLIGEHVAAIDPHGDRAYTDAAILAQGDNGGYARHFMMGAL